MGTHTLLEEAEKKIAAVELEKKTTAEEAEKKMATLRDFAKLMIESGGDVAIGDSEPTHELVVSTVEKINAMKAEIQQLKEKMTRVADVAKVADPPVITAPSEIASEKVTTSPAKATEVPAKATEVSAIATEAPPKATEAPAIATEAPAKATEATEAPAKATEVPTKATEATEVPAKATEVPSVN